MPLRTRTGATHGRRFAMVAATAIVTAAACGAPAPEPARDGWAEASHRGHGRVTVLYVLSPGFAYTDAGGRLTGLTVELMREFARFVEQRHAVALELAFEEEPDWRTFYERVRDGAGGLFGLGNVTITPQRRTELRFSPPYMANVAVLITHESVPELHAIDALGAAFAGLRPLAYAGTLHEGRLESLRSAHMPEVPLELANSNVEILERVAIGPDYFAYIDVYHYWRARQAGAPLRRHPAADLASEEIGIIMPLDSDWAPVLADFFHADGGLLEQPLYRSLLEHHLGAEVAALLEAARAGTTQRTGDGT